ncbi:hypothetical protein LIER_25903 [Lithospermum erythrorhizon]|uniref:Uncharacterized protein n=1 Tax=Lithospermum erythrorhizon TaxID=34254 RepID=A0AAV3R8K2_LITER
MQIIFPDSLPPITKTSPQESILSTERPIYEEVRVCPTKTGKEDWRSPIIKFLTTGKLPEEKVEAWKLQSRSNKFQMFQDELYKVSQLELLMYCVPEEKRGQTLNEVHK